MGRKEGKEKEEGRREGKKDREKEREGGERERKLGGRGREGGRERMSLLISLPGAKEFTKGPSSKHTSPPALFDHNISKTTELGN